MPLGTEVDLGPEDIVLDGDPAPKKGARPPIFGPYLLWPNGRPSQLLLSSCFTYINFFADRPDRSSMCYSLYFTGNICFIIALRKGEVWK